MSETDNRPVMQQPKTREEIAMSLFIGEASDVVDKQRENIEVLAEMIVTGDALREAIQVHADQLKKSVDESTVELVSHYREAGKMLSDFRINAGDQLAAPMLAGVARVVRRELNRTVLIAGGSAAIGVVVGIVIGGVIARFF